MLFNTLVGMESSSISPPLVMGKHAYIILGHFIAGLLVNIAYLYFHSTFFSKYEIQIVATIAWLNLSPTWFKIFQTGEKQKRNLDINNC